MRDANHSFSGVDGNLEILSKPAGVPNSGERAFHAPVLGQFLPFIRLNFLRDVNS